MKLQCSIKVLNRILPSLSMNSATKYKNAVIGVQKKNKEYFVIVVTQNNKAGYRYKITGNIEKTFGQFSGDGKCTIRFKEPCHDLCITADKLQLRNFMLYIKKAWKGELDEKESFCINFNSVPQCEPKTYKLIIRKKQDYPVLKGFPKMLQALMVSDCKLTKVDSRILNLNHLTSLSLSTNKITTIPQQLGSLPLKQLFLDNNDLKNENWLFLSGPIMTSLECLDISCNSLKYIPPALSRFKSLSTFKVSKNSISSIPFRICLLPKLQDINISYNDLTSLPGTVYRRNLNTLDVSGNKALFFTDGLEQYNKNKLYLKGIPKTVPRLIELAGIRVIDSRLPYSEHVFPLNIVKLLDNAGQCFCGRTTLVNHGWRRFTTLTRTVANTFTSTEGQCFVPIAFASCSIHSVPE